MCITVLAVLLLVSIGILSYRFVELAQKEKDNHFDKMDVQTNIQTGDLQQQIHQQGV